MTAWIMYSMQHPYRSVIPSDGASSLRDKARVESLP
jgi:hypothetical protein